ncbi:MAG: acyltransferase [Bacteroidota bacterium]
MAKIFFKGLNELRAIAALAVVFHHIELFKSKDFKASLFSTPLEYFTAHIGKNGVYLFFVLSGFLITYLLLQEKNNFKTINLLKFYFRRIFRIWPLYYLIILISFLLIPLLANEFEIFKGTPYFFDRITDPVNYSSSSLLCYLFFLPNLAIHFNYIVVGSSQTWSVGVEEQFYILWPLLILFFKKKYMPFAFLGIIIIMPFFSYFILPIFSFEYMSIGALGGYTLFYFPDLIKTFFKKRSLIYFLIIGLILFFMSIGLVHNYIQSIILAVLFIALILNTVTSDSKHIFSSSAFSFIGKISYGVYMYHPFLMFLIFPIANRYFEANGIVYNVFLYFFIPGLSILLSHLSYKYFELKFIKIKDSKFNTL